MDSNIKRAKKLLNLVLKKITPNKKIDDVIIKVAEEAKGDLKRTYSCSQNDIFGVFSKDDVFKGEDSEQKGKVIVQRISNGIVKKFKKIVVTGDTIYYFKSGKINRQKMHINNIEKAARQDDRETWRITFSRILGHIPESAIFLIDDSRSASIFEESSFHQRKRDFGLGIIITDKSVRFCRGDDLMHIRTSKIEYYQCSNKADYENKCIKGGSGCLMLKLKLNKTTIEPFIKKRTHFLIIARNVKKIDQIACKVISENHPILLSD